MEIHLPEDLERFVRDQVRTGRFPSEDQVVREALEHFKDAQIPPLQESAVPKGPLAEEAKTMESHTEDQGAEERPLWEVITQIARRVPDEEWAKLPPDASYQLDHYLYGSPKKP